MFVGQFDPKKRIVWVQVRLFGPNGDTEHRFILDTGTGVTVVDPCIVEDLGYSARMGTSISRLIGIDGVQEGYGLKLNRMELLGFASGRMTVEP